VTVDGPPNYEDPSWSAWSTGQDNLLAILIENGASLSKLMTRLFCHLPDNLLHGAVKNAIETGKLATDNYHGSEHSMSVRHSA
jgi:hypothetical protein